MYCKASTPMLPWLCCSAQSGISSNQTCWWLSVGLMTSRQRPSRSWRNLSWRTRVYEKNYVVSRLRLRSWKVGLHCLYSNMPSQFWSSLWCSTISVLTVYLCSCKEFRLHWLNLCVSYICWKESTCSLILMGFLPINRYLSNIQYDDHVDPLVIRINPVIHHMQHLTY